MSLDGLLEQLSILLKGSQLTLVTAESCTAGGLSYVLTTLPGSSEWFERGFVTYSNKSKLDLLNVKESTISVHGAVSKETAIEMAEGALRNSSADLSIAITGVAGPDGGTALKPVGTVWIAYGKKEADTSSSVFNFNGDREQIRKQAIMQAIVGLLERLPT